MIDLLKTELSVEFLVTATGYGYRENKILIWENKLYRWVEPEKSVESIWKS